MTGSSGRPSELGADVAGLVLAGGRSRRMGGCDKSELVLGRHSMLEIVLDRMRPQVARLAVSANSGLRRDLGLPVLPDAEFVHAGPLAGILAGLRWASTEAPSANWIVTAATDTPFLPPSLVPRLLVASPQPTVARVAASRGKVHPVFGLWPIDLAPTLEQWLTNGLSRKVRDWVEHIPHVIAEFGDVDGSDPFFNVNTPDDVMVARAMLSEAAS